MTKSSSSFKEYGQADEANGYVLSEVLVSIMIAAIAIGGLIFGLRSASDAQLVANRNFKELLNCQRNIETYRASNSQSSNIGGLNRGSFSFEKKSVEIVFDGKNLILPSQFGGITLTSLKCGLPKKNVIETYVLEPF